MTSSPERNYNSSDKGIIFLSEDESSASKMKNLARRIEHLLKRFREKCCFRVCCTHYIANIESL